MKWILSIFLLVSIAVFAQELTYTPGQTVSKTIEKSYYNTDYINFTYSGSTSIELYFELIKDTANQNWHRALCSNTICYTKLPEYGTIGTFKNGDQGYLAISLSTGDEVGSGTFKYRIYSTSTNQIDDTITFHYEILDSEKILNEPWVKINFQENVVFVLFKNAQLISTMEIFDLSGNVIAKEEVSGTFSYSLANLKSGVYIVRIKSESGQEEIKRILKI